MTTRTTAREVAAMSAGTAPRARRLEPLSCPIDAITRQELLAELAAHIARREPTTVLFVNVAKLVWARRDPALRQALAQADYVLADGQPLVWVSRLLGQPLPERIAGIDLMEDMLAAAAQKGWRVFFLGAREPVLRQAIENLTRRHIGLQVAGAHHGYFPAEETERVLEQINRSNADLLLVALGSPQKELWLMRYGPRLNVPLRQAVGGSFEIAAGHRRRAPAWLRRLGLEWFYRLLQDPRHLGWRYFYTNTVFLLLVTQALLRRRRQRPR